MPGDSSPRAKSAGTATSISKVGPDVDGDVKLAKAVRALAPDCFLWADANGGYDTATALAAAPKLRDAGVNVLEQPVPPNRLERTRRPEEARRSADHPG